MGQIEFTPHKERWLYLMTLIGATKRLVIYNRDKFRTGAWSLFYCFIWGWAISDTNVTSLLWGPVIAFAQLASRRMGQGPRPLDTVVNGQGGCKPQYYTAFMWDLYVNFTINVGCRTSRRKNAAVERRREKYELDQIRSCLYQCVSQWRMARCDANFLRQQTLCAGPGSDIFYGRCPVNK